MSFKMFFFLQLWYLVLWNRTIYAIFADGFIREVIVKYFEFGPVVQEENWPKIRNRYNQVSHLTQDTIWGSDKTQFVQFVQLGTRPYVEHLCEVIFNLGQCFKIRCHLKKNVNTRCMKGDAQPILNDV